MREKLKEKIINKLASNPKLLTNIEDRWLSPDVCLEVMRKTKYEGFEHVPEKFKDQTMYDEWMKATNYKDYKYVPNKYVTPAMSAAA